MYLLAKYNTTSTFTFPLVKGGSRNLATSADWTPAGGDTKISKDGAAVGNTSNNPSAVSGTGSVIWTLTLLNTELTAAVIDIQIVDTEKAVEDQFLKIYTYGNASAKIPLDLSDLIRAGLVALPAQPVEAAGGLYTRGSGPGQIIQPSNGLISVNTSQISGVVQSGGNVTSDVLTLLNRIPAALFTGVTSLGQWLGAIMGKQTPNATALAEIRATGASGGGTYDPVLKSLEGFYDSTATAAQVSDAVTSEIKFKKNVAQRFTFTMYTAGTRNPRTGVVPTLTTQISKDGAAFAGLSGSPAVSEIGTSGHYHVIVAASDMNADNIILKFTHASCDETTLHIVTQAA